MQIRYSLVQMNDYSQIFSQRALQYHLAMQSYPHARDAEFQAILQDLPTTAIDILDVPSGGGYLQAYLSAEKRLQSCDFSAGFASEAVPLGSPAHLPFPPASFDAVLSLTGLHHVTVSNQIVFLSECGRVLRPGGRLIVGEVLLGSAVDAFLNLFVDQHNSQGHQGEFFGEHFQASLRASGFSNIKYAVRHYYWRFDDVDAMVFYCRNMFGIDKASDQQIQQGLLDYLNYQENADGSIRLPWQLVFFQAVNLYANINASIAQTTLEST